MVSTSGLASYPVRFLRACWQAAKLTPALAALYPGRRAPVAELVDALDSKSSSARNAGSSPARGTSGPRGGLLDARHSRCRSQKGVSDRFRPPAASLFVG